MQKYLIHVHGEIIVIVVEKQKQVLEVDELRDLVKHGKRIISMTWLEMFLIGRLRRATPPFVLLEAVATTVPVLTVQLLTATTTGPSITGSNNGTRLALYVALDTE